MSDIFDNLSDKIQNISNRVAKDGKKYFQSAFSKGEEIGYKGKIKLEIEKLKWELKKNIPPLVNMFLIIKYPNLLQIFLMTAILWNLQMMCIN